jgi:16S rRNA (uracil1498-N3)-methyltransferase
MNSLESSDKPHCFALYVPTITVQGNSLILHDPSLLHRIQHVLRLKEGEECILFDDQSHYRVKFVKMARAGIRGTIVSQVRHTPFLPSITWLLPILKRESFEEALYNLAQMGTTSIQPLITAKTSRSWGSEKEYARVRSLLISSAEQSKSYILPIMHPVQAIMHWKPYDAGATKILFDGDGVLLKDWLVPTDIPSALIGCVGPEGGLTAAEKSYLRSLGFVTCALTPTVLRAVEAVTLGMGILRSYYR